MNGSLPNRRSATKNNSGQAYGQHKRGSNTASSRNSLASIIKQNEVKNTKTHNKENLLRNNHSVSNGEKTIAHDDSIKSTADERVLQNINQNLSNLTLEKGQSLKSNESSNANEIEDCSLKKVDREKSSESNGHFERSDTEKASALIEPSNEKEELGETNQTENIEEKDTADCIQSDAKHPLQHSWSFWYFKNDRSRDWTDNLMKIHDVDTVEDFWCLYMHVEDVSKLGAGCDYALFKTGIMPTWEDKENESGGRWLLQFDSKQRHRGLDYYWREILMYLIGNEMENDIINGAVVNVRHKQDKISLWLSTSGRADEDQILKTGRQIKARLDLKDMPINFEVHKESQSKKSSMSKFAYTL